MKKRILLLTAFLALHITVPKLDGAQSGGCSLGGAAVAFGAYDPTSGMALDTTGSLIYRCGQKDHNIIVTLSQGGGTSYPTRRMVHGNNQLFYNLYLDAGRTIIWGDGTGGTQSFTISNPGNNQDLTVPIFGRIPAQQNVSVGNYSDTITITLDRKSVV